MTIAKTSLATAFAAGLAFCGPALAQEAVTLNVWSDTARVPVFEEYDSTRDNVTLNIVTVAPADLVAKLQLSLQAKSDIPDVIFMSSIAYASQLSTRRASYLMDLTDVIPAALQDEFAPNANSPCLINGKLLCLRNDLAHMLVWYDAPLLEQLGKTVPTTWDEFAALGNELGKEGYWIGSGVEAWPTVNLLTASGCAVGLPVEGKPDTVKIDLTGEDCLRGAQLVDDLVASGGYGKVGIFEPDFVKAFQDGKVPLMVGPGWFGEFVIKTTYEMPAGQLANALPLKWADQEQPITWSWGGGTFGGWKDTAHPEAVIDLITWAATDVAHQAKATTMPAHQPSAEAWSEGLIANEYYANDQIFATLEEAATFSNPGYTSLRFDITGSVGRILGQAITGGGTAVSALPALQDELINQAKLNGYTVE